MQEIKLSPRLSKLIEKFVGELKRAYAEDLISAYLYGSAASGEFNEGYSNINLLIVLKNNQLPDLDKAKGIVNRLEFRWIDPLFLNEDYIRTSLDTFPIEFLDIKENNILLFGKDVLIDKEIDLKNLRFQCEQELKARLLNLKHRYLSIGPKDKLSLENLLIKNLNSLLHILRNVVRLKGKQPSYTKQAIIQELGTELKIDTVILEKIFSKKADFKKLNYAEINLLLNELVIELEKIIKAVNEL